MNTSNQREWLVLLGFLMFVGVTVFFMHPNQLAIKALSESDILALVSTLFVVAIFVERANESILIPIRTPDRQSIELEIENAKAAPASDEAAATLRQLNATLLQYRLGTAKLAYWTSLLLGIMISLVGVRIIETLVVIPPDLGTLQRQWLAYVDIVLTGCVISGGSAAMDKIGRRISDAYNLRSVTNQGVADNK